jgi:hypothetical protein
VTTPISFSPATFDGNTVYDGSGFGNDGTVYGATLVDGKIGKALYFDGLNDYVNVSSLIDYPLSQFTFEMWLNTNNNLTYNSGNRGFATEGNDYVLRYNSGANYAAIRCSFINMTNGDQVVETDLSHNLTKNTWYHILCAWNGTKTSIYENGKYVNSGDTIGIPRSFMDHVAIGQYDPNVYFNGTIDEVRIFDRALTPDETILLRPADYG